MNRLLTISTQLVFLFFGVLCQTAEYDRRIVCRSDPVSEGETAVMTFSFNCHNDVIKENFLISLRNQTRQDVLVCDKMDENKPMRTRIYNKKYKTDCVVNNTLTVLVPGATVDLNYGEHQLSFFGCTKDSIQTRCNFTVLRRAEIVGTPENSSEVKTVIVPIIATIAAVVTIGIIIAVLVVRRRRRNRGDNVVPTTDPDNFDTNDKDLKHTDTNTSTNARYVTA